jgi:hypothetical protein
MKTTLRSRRKVAKPRFEQRPNVEMTDDGDLALYTEEEAAQILRMSVRQLANRRRARKIDCIKDGAFIAYTKKHLRDFCKGAHQPSNTDKRVELPTAAGKQKPDPLSVILVDQD